MVVFLNTVAGPLRLLTHPAYRISAFQGFFKPHSIYILNYNIFPCYLLVTYLLPT